MVRGRQIKAGWALGALALGSLVLAACYKPSGLPVGAKFYPDQNPSVLSDWGIFTVSSGGLDLADGVVPYDLNTPLFTDYAHKLRTIWVSGDKEISLSADGVFDYPVGTVISKTFYYPRAEDGAVAKTADSAGTFSPLLGDLSDVRLMETRLLVHRAGGWEAISYVWTDDQTEAELTRIGDVQKLTLADDDGVRTDFAYVVPNINQCSGCHAPNNTTKELQPLGFNPRHLNKSFQHGDRLANQLDYLVELDYLAAETTPDALPKNANWLDTSASLTDRARAYIDINCSHCHNPVGPADTSGLHLGPEAPMGREYGLCKTPIAAGHGTGGRLYDIVPGDPDASILLHRMEITDPGSLMPELGRSLVHEEGATLIRDWIATIEGVCET